MSYYVDPTATTYKLEWTNKILPHDNDKTWKVVAKFALVIMTLGSIFLVTLTRDLTKNVYVWLTTKKPEQPKPLTTGEKAIGSLKLAAAGVFTSVISPFMPIYWISKNQNSIAKWCYASTYVGTTSAILGYLAGPRAACAILAGHAITLSIQPIANYLWSKKDTAKA
ncbi:MAG: hypothetical protein K940chlam1_00905 [Candidatus Anoxychlamydiales bacterium]|nr:hypothetical protein [Candidatus Anoxychlamydiales bacterium]NGX36534.1 hypothetical protein [Candidatus Anoxychlamydiales bacterium]